LLLPAVLCTLQKLDLRLYVEKSFGLAKCLNLQLKFLVKTAFAVKKKRDMESETW